MNIEEKEIKFVKGNKILVRVEKREEKAGSLYVPENTRTKERRGLWEAIVVKLGDKVDFEQWKPYTVCVGDKVLIDPQCQDCPTFQGADDSKLRFIRDEDIFGKMVPA